MNRPTRNFNAETRNRGENRAIGSSDHRAIGHEFSECFRNALRIVRVALREIFDESAYERFLLHTRLERSVASYRQFLRERETAISRKPRCC